MKSGEDGFDAEKLLLEINSGKSLRPEDEKLVGELLAAPENRLLGRHLSQDDIYSLVLVVGRAKVKKFRHLIAAFLDRDDPLTVSLVLEVLCLEWKETAEYLERVISFALGVPWDVEGDVRQTAIKVIGEYLKSVIPAAPGSSAVALTPANQHVLSLLIHLFDDDDDDWIRFAAYRALLRSGGTAEDALPSEGLLPDLSPKSPELNQEVLVRLRGLAGYSSESFSESSKSAKGPASMR